MKRIGALLVIVSFGVITSAADWEIPADRSFTLPSFCPLAGEASLVYPVCTDQVAKLDAAIQAAKASGKQLIVQFGATWCGYTKLNHAFWTAGGVFDSKQISDRYLYVGIALSTRVSNQKTRVESGHEAMDLLWATLGKTGVEAGFKGYPFVTIFDPSGIRAAQEFETPSIETSNSFSYDLPKTIEALLSRP